MSPSRLLPPDAERVPPRGANSFYISWCSRHEEYHFSVVRGLSISTKHIMLWRNLHERAKLEMMYLHKEEVLWDVLNT